MNALSHTLPITPHYLRRTVTQSHPQTLPARPAFCSTQRSLLGQVLFRNAVSLILALALSKSAFYAGHIFHAPMTAFRDQHLLRKGQPKQQSAGPLIESNVPVEQRINQVRRLLKTNGLSPGIFLFHPHADLMKGVNRIPLLPELYSLKDYQWGLIQMAKDRKTVVISLHNQVFAIKEDNTIWRAEGDISNLRLLALATAVEQGQIWDTIARSDHLLTGAWE